MLPKDPAYKLLFVPLHKATINQSHNLNVQNVSNKQCNHSLMTLMLYKVPSRTIRLVACLRHVVLLWHSSLQCYSAQLDRTVTASIILTHKACPAGFDVVLEGVNEHTCRCSSTDVNVISCNTSSEDILIRVRLGSVHAY